MLHLQQQHTCTTQYKKDQSMTKSLQVDVDIAVAFGMMH